MNRTVRLFLFLLCCKLAQGADIYIAQSSTGSDTGADSANAHGAAWFNTSGNWGNESGKIKPGDTVHLTGNITTTLNVQQGGTAGNVTRILFDPGARMSAPAWTSSGAIVLNGTPYVTIDGGATETIGGPGASGSGANGIIESTANGATLANQVSNASGIIITNSDNTTVKGLTIRNLFVRASGADEVSHGNQAVKVDGSSHVLITNCIFHDSERGALFVYRSGTTNLEYSHTTAYNCNWGGGCGPGSDGSSLSSLLVHDNYFYGWSNWDDTSTGNFYHHNGFFCFGTQFQPNSTASGIRYYNNKIGSGTSGEWGTRASSGLWIQDKVTDVRTYNNLCITDSTSHPNNGLIGFNPAGATTGTYEAYNNTLIGLSKKTGTGVYIDAWQSTGGAQTIIVRNNIISGMRLAVAVFNNATFTLTFDHNLIYGNDGSSPYSYSSTSAGSFKSLADWQALGFDGDLITHSPSLDSGYKPQLNSPVIGTAANLSSAFNSDASGGARSATGAWDIGAFTYTKRPVSPGNLRVAR